MCVDRKECDPKTQFRKVAQREYCKTRQAIFVTKRAPPNHNIYEPPCPVSELQWRRKSTSLAQMHPENHEEAHSQGGKSGRNACREPTSSRDVLPHVAPRTPASPSYADSGGRTTIG